MMSRAFITGCDRNNEWMLPWFLYTYTSNRNKTPIVFVDFGVTTERLEWCKANFDEVIPKDRLHQTYNCTWFLKPEAIMSVDAERKVWLDTDCEIDGNIDGIFDLLVHDKLNMVPDGPWTRRSHEKWHNSGVIGVIGKPKILYNWHMECKINQSPMGPTHRGDQEVLHAMIKNSNTIGIREQYIHDLPHKYNVLRLDIQDKIWPEDPLIFHWTGAKGKDEIKQKIKKFYGSVLK